MRCVVITLFLALLALLILAGCASIALPEPAITALGDSFQELTGSAFGGRIESVVKASGSAADINFEEISASSEDFISGCPVDLGGEEAWCVTLDQEYTSSSGVAFSHYIIQRNGEYWSADALTPTEAYATFYLAGCSNWDSVLPVAQAGGDQ